MNPILIDKEQVKNLAYFPYAVLTNAKNKLERNEKLHQALLLGNAPDHTKVVIVLSTQQVYFKINTTIWAVDDKNIQLKSGSTIPISAI